MLKPALIFLSSIAVSFFITYPTLWVLSFFHVGQPVREEGPSAHRSKAGTITMGGIGFILSTIILSFVLIDFEFNPQYLAIMLLFVAYALIGFIDDLLKITRGKNLGLTFWQKIIAQFAAAAIFAGSVMINHWGVSSSIFYGLFMVFVIVGAANATNLTDGLNGLLAGTAGIAFLAFFTIAYRLHLLNAYTLCLVFGGSVLAFLYFNFPHAKAFMGDVGSLSIGAALAGIAIVLHKELLLIIIGGIFVIETLSVILQVISYKLFKKRIFKMAPLHHHFELLGIKEMHVVIGFWCVGVILAVIGCSF